MAYPANLRNERSGLFGTGRTGSFKSSLTQAFMCLYGAGFLNDDLILKWGPGATNNSLARFCTQAADLPLLIDNYKPNTGGGARAMVELIHTLMEGGEKNRLNRNSEQKETVPFRVWPVFTGEDLPDGDAAAIARCVVVPFAWMGDENAHLTKAQEGAHHLPLIGSSWIQWLLTEHGQATAKEWGRKFPERRASWANVLRKKRSDMVNLFRVASNIAVLDIAWSVARQCPALAETLKPYDSQFQHALHTLAGTMANHTCHALEANRFIEAVQALLSSDRHFLGSINYVDDNEKRERLGWQDDEHIYLNLEYVKSKVIQLTRDSGALSGVSSNTLNKQFEQLGMLSQTGKDGKTAKVKKINGKSERVLWFKRSVFDHPDENED